MDKQRILKKKEWSFDEEEITDFDESKSIVRSEGQNYIIKSNLGSK